MHLRHRECSNEVARSCRRARLCKQLCPSIEIAGLVAIKLVGSDPGPSDRLRRGISPEPARRGKKHTAGGWHLRILQVEQ
jgi:hypothetical protein